MKVAIDRHIKDLCADFTIEFEVKSPDIPKGFPEDVWEAEWTTGSFTNAYAQKAFLEISRSGYQWLDDWSFVGRSNGWYALLCKGSGAGVQPRSIDRIEKIVQRYYNAYGKELAKHYGI